MRVTLKTINDELKRLGHDAQLLKGDGYFYFTSGETVDWLDRTIRVPTISTLTLEEWIAEFEKLKKLNRDLLGGKVSPIKADDDKGPVRKTQDVSYAFSGRDCTNLKTRKATRRF